MFEPAWGGLLLATTVVLVSELEAEVQDFSPLPLWACALRASFCSCKTFLNTLQH